MGVPRPCGTWRLTARARRSEIRSRYVVPLAGWAGNSRVDDERVSSFEFFQVGAVIGSMCGPARESAQRVQCASLKSNVGHMEACAAAAGLASLSLAALGTSTVVGNARLIRFVVSAYQVRLVGTHDHWTHRLNAHLSSMVLSSFEMPAEVAARVAGEDADR